MRALRVVSLLVVLSLLLSLVPATPVAVADGPAPRLLPVDGSWKDMSSKWWQWIMSYPVASMPLLQESTCSVGKSGNTLFLAGGVWTGGNSFNCDIPGGKQLFLPVANTLVYPFLHVPGERPVDKPAVIRSGAKAYIDGVHDLQAVVDGIPVKNVQRYRLPSPSTFPITVPKDNIFGYPQGVYKGMGSDGYYLLLAPMSPGLHTIYVHAVFPDGFTVDATFGLNVLR